MFVVAAKGVCLIKAGEDVDIPDEVLRRGRAAPSAAGVEPRPVRLRRRALPLRRNALAPGCCPAAPLPPAPFCSGPSPWHCSRVYRLLAGSGRVKGVTSFPTGRWPPAASLEPRREVGCEAVVRRACGATHDTVLGFKWQTSGSLQSGRSRHRVCE